MYINFPRTLFFEHVTGMFLPKKAHYMWLKQRISCRYVMGQSLLVQNYRVMSLKNCIPTSLTTLVWNVREKFGRWHHCIGAYQKYFQLLMISPKNPHQFLAIMIYNSAVIGHWNHISRRTRKNFVWWSTLFHEKWTHQNTKEKLVKYYGRFAPLIRIVSQWFQNVRSLHIHTRDTACSRRPGETLTPGMIIEIHASWMNESIIFYTYIRA